MQATDSSGSQNLGFPPQTEQLGSHKLIRQIREVIDKWEQVPPEVATPPTTSSVSLPLQHPQPDPNLIQTRERIRACRSLKDIENLLEDKFKVDREEDKVMCIICHAKGDSKLGVFNSNEVEYDAFSQKSRKLLNLQKNILVTLHN